MIKKFSIFEKSMIDSNGVLLDSPFLITNNENLPEDATFKIGDYVHLKNVSKFFYKIKHYYNKPPYPYECFIVSYPHEDFSKTWVTEDEIVLISEDKLEEYQLKISADKYNL